MPDVIKLQIAYPVSMYAHLDDQYACGQYLEIVKIVHAIETEQHALIIPTTKFL